jgi:hypothetical protein
MLHASETCNALYLEETTTYSFSHMSCQYLMEDTDWFSGYKETFLQNKMQTLGESVFLAIRKSYGHWKSRPYVIYRLIYSYKITCLNIKCTSISVWTFSKLAGLRQNVSLKGGKLWKLSYTIKEKLKETTDNYRELTNTILSMGRPHDHFLYSVKAFCSFAMAEA